MLLRCSMHMCCFIGSEFRTAFSTFESWPVVVFLCDWLICHVLIYCFFLSIFSFTAFTSKFWQVSFVLIRVFRPNNERRSSNTLFWGSLYFFLKSYFDISAGTLLGGR
jgi:hypothetical protein